MMKNALLIFILISCTIFFNRLEISGQENMYQIFNNEKVYLSLPKNIHVAGEKMEYTTFLINQYENTRLKSKIIYYALKNKYGHQVLHWWDRVNTTLTPGAIILPDTLSEGIYSLQAYTNWMRNLPGEYIFHTRLYIAKLSDETKPELETNYKGLQERELIVKPEGGKLIKGIKNRLIFYYPDGKKLGDSTIVLISNQTGDTLSMKRIENGEMGKVVFTPGEGQHTLTLLSGMSKEIKTLPPVEEFGYTIITDVSAKNSVKIKLYTNMPDFSGYRVGKLLIRKDNQDYYSKELHFKADSLSISLPDNTVTPGISNLLLEVNDEFVINRLIHGVSGHDKNIKIDLPREKFQTREKATFKIYTDELNELDTVLLSVSIRKKIPPIIQDQPNMVNFLKSSSASTTVPSSLKPADANIYLATREAGPDKPKKNHSNTSSFFFPEIQGYLIAGNIKNNDDGSPLAGQKVLLTYKDTLPNLDYSITDEHGQFVFLVNENYDNKLLLLMLDNDSLDIQWEIDNKSLQSNHAGFKKTVTLHTETVNTIKNYKKNYLINKIYQETTNHNHEEQPKAFSWARWNTYRLSPDETIYPGDFYNLKNFEEIASNILPGVRFSGKGGKPYLRLFNVEKQSYWEMPPMTFLNGIPFNDLNYIATLGTKEIKKIDINRNCVFYGNITFYGVLSIVTTDSKIPRAYIDKHQKINHEKLSVNTENKVDKINIDLSGNGNYPLLHSLLLWDPELKFPGNENQELEFFTPDLPGDYIITVEGLINNATPVHLKKNFIVE